MKELGNRIAKIRNHMELTKTEMAKLLDVGQPNYSVTESEGKFITLPILIKLAEKGYNLNWLLTGKGNMLLTDQATLDTIHKHVLKLSDVLNRGGSNSARGKKNVSK